MRRAWLAFWVSAFTGMAVGINAVVLALTESLWYAIFAGVDFGCVVILVWAIIQLRKADAVDRREQADAAERLTVVRNYLDAVRQGSDLS